MINYKKSDYSIKEFLRSIKKEISRIVGIKVTYRILSTEFLSYKNKYHVQNRINSAKGNSNYFLDKKLLTRYLNSIRNQLNKYGYQNEISSMYQYFKKYHDNNLNYTKNNNPNLIKEYFKTIDNLEKAYWLGWIFAEGYIGNRGGIYFTISTSVKDGIQLKRFIKCINANPYKIEYYRKDNNKRIKRYFRLNIRDKIFIEHLLECSVPSGAKSGIIKLPKFATFNIYKAFLLGYFDGDGHRGDSPQISSKSKDFLLDIKNYFNELKNKKIGIHKKKDKIIGYYLLLTPTLFNSLLDIAKNNNIKNLERKGIKYLTPSIKKK